jgi:hypothetical protein
LSTLTRQHLERNKKVGSIYAHVPPVGGDANHIKRYNEMPEWAQLLIRYPKQIIWFGLPLTPFLLGSMLGLISPIMPLVGIGLTIAYYVAAYVEVSEKDNQPQFAILEVLGLRLPIVYDEGFNFIIPIISRLVLRSKEQINKDIEISGVRCRLEPMNRPASIKSFAESILYALRTPSPPKIGSGGSVKVSLGLTFEREWRDGWFVLDFDNAGEFDGVFNILRDQIEEDLREIGRRLDWLELSFATQFTSAHIIAELTGKKRLNGRHIFEDATLIERYLSLVKQNGISYIGGLGLKVRRVQVKNVSPEGKLLEAAERAAVEKLRRDGLLENTAALTAAVRRMKTSLKDGSLTENELLTFVLLNDEDARIKKEILEFNSNNIQAVADAIQQAIAAFIRKGGNP